MGVGRLADQTRNDRRASVVQPAFSQCGSILRQTVDNRFHGQLLFDITETLSKPRQHGDRNASVLRGQYIAPRKFDLERRRSKTSQGGMSQSLWSLVSSACFSRQPPKGGHHSRNIRLGHNDRHISTISCHTVSANTFRQQHDQDWNCVLCWINPTQLARM